LLFKVVYDGFGNGCDVEYFFVLFGFVVDCGVDVFDGEDDLDVLVDLCLYFC